MRGYNRKDPTGYPSMDYDKRRRHTYRRNQYEGSSSAAGQQYKSKRQNIKRKPQILECNSGRRLTKTSGARSVTKKGIIIESVPTDTMRNEFFSLLECNVYSMQACFGRKEDIYFSLENMDDDYLHINQENIAHLMGISGLLSDTSLIWKCGLSKWRGLSRLEKLQAMFENKELIRDFEEKNGVIINYTKGKEKNKSLFIFDLFNLKKKLVSARRMKQSEVDELYGQYYGYKKSEKQESDKSDEYVDYIILERKKKIDGKSRYITMMFKREGNEQNPQRQYFPVSIIETSEPKLSRIEKNGTTIKIVSPISIFDSVKHAIMQGTTQQDVRDSNIVEARIRDGRKDLLKGD